MTTAIHAALAARLAAAARIESAARQMAEALAALDAAESAVLAAVPRGRDPRTVAAIFDRAALRRSISATLEASGVNGLVDHKLAGHVGVTSIVGAQNQAAGDFVR